jgi:hypothetical protein
MSLRMYLEVKSVYLLGDECRPDATQRRFQVIFLSANMRCQASARPWAYATAVAAILGHQPRNLTTNYLAPTVQVCPTP